MRRILRLFVLLAITAVFSIRINAAQVRSFTLLSEVTAEPRTVLPPQVGTERIRYAAVNFDALTQTRDNSELVLNLFDDVSYVAVNKRIEPRVLGREGYVWIGTLRDVPYSNVLLIVANGFIQGRVLMPGRNYTIAPTTTVGLQTVSEINTSIQRPTPEHDDSVIVETESSSNFALPRVDGRADDGSVIDVMVVYTPAAVDFLGGVANTETAIEAAVALANLTYENSLINFRLRLVHTEQVNYVERGYMDLSNLSGTNDGFMDNVHGLRDTYAADLVTLIPGTSVSERNYCGIAQLPAPSAGTSAQAFSIVEALCISDITYAHELGHNMGSAHDRANATTGRTSYAFGYQDPRTGPDDWGDFVTVMAYSTNGNCPPSYQPGVCPAIAFWSNPDLTFDGKPLGYPMSQWNRTNNTLSLNEVAYTIANYRVSSDGGAPTETPEPTATYTPYVEPTVYPVTPTPVGGIQLLLNTGFENDSDQDLIPDGWRGIKLSSDVRVCGKVARSQQCAFRFIGGTGEKSQLTQNVLGTVNPDDMLTLNAYVRSTAIKNGAQLQLVIRYTTASGLPVARVTLPITAGLKTYTPVSGSIVVEGEVASIRVILRYNNSNATGRFFVDDVTLRRTAP